MLGTWLSLSTRATARVTTFVAHSEEQMLPADELADMGLSPVFLEDILTCF
jgi:DNA-binding IscR family transcriptional regulator